MMHRTGPSPNLPLSFFNSALDSLLAFVNLYGAEGDCLDQAPITL